MQGFKAINAVAVEPRFDNLPVGTDTIAVEFSKLPQGVTATYEARDAEMFLPGKDGLPSYTLPSPWTPCSKRP